MRSSGWAAFWILALVFTLGIASPVFALHPLIQSLHLPDSIKTEFDSLHRHLSPDFLNKTEVLTADLAAAASPSADAIAIRILEADYLSYFALYQEALTVMESLAADLESLNSEVSLVSIYFHRTLGILYSLTGLLDPANVELIRSLELAKIVQDKDQIMLGYLELGELARKRNDTQFAGQYLEEAENLEDESKLSGRTLAYYYNRRPGLLAVSLDPYYRQNAEAACLKAIEYAQKEDLPYLIASTENELGMIRRDNTLETSSAHWRKAARIWKGIGADRDLALAYLNLGMTYLDLGKCDSSLKYLNLGQEAQQGRVWEYVSISLAGHKARYYELCATNTDSLVHYWKKAFQFSMQEGDLRKANRNFAADFAYQANRLKQSVQETESKLEYANEKRRMTVLFVVLLAIGLLVILWVSLQLRAANRQLKQTLVLLESANIDLTDRIQEKEILLDEVHHRVKNNFAVILSLLRFHTRMESGGEAHPQALEQLANRIKAMASIQTLLYESDNLREVKAAGFVEELAEECLEMMGFESADLQINCPAITLQPWRAMLLGTIVSELITNSVKHSFKDLKKGEIWIQIDIVGTELIFIYRDSGIPPLASDSMGSSGMGMRILESAILQLNGKKMNLEHSEERLKFRF